MDRYSIEPSSNNGCWIVKDALAGIDIEFDHQCFNEARKITFHNQSIIQSPLGMARALRLIGEWLVKYHYDKVFRHG